MQCFILPFKSYDQGISFLCQKERKAAPGWDHFSPEVNILHDCMKQHDAWNTKAMFLYFGIDRFRNFGLSLILRWSLQCRNPDVFQ